MAQVGCLGSRIIFETSDQRILTFTGFTQKISGRWSKHSIIGGKPLSEFNGPELRSVSFKVDLNALHGVPPRTTAEAIEEAVEKGLVYPLIIGSRRVGNYRWKISSMSENWDVIYSRGEVAKISLSITLEEYV